jgi:hypothetical protein
LDDQFDVYQEDDDIPSSFTIDDGINLDSLVGDVEVIQVDDAEMEAVSRDHDSEMEDQDDSSEEGMDE